MSAFTKLFKETQCLDTELDGIIKTSKDDLCYLPENDSDTEYIVDDLDHFITTITATATATATATNSTSSSKDDNMAFFNVFQENIASLDKKYMEYIAKSEQFMKTITEKLGPGAESFLKKKDYTDPVTGEQRFGENMKVKIVKLSSDVEQLLKKANALISHIQIGYDIVQQKRETLNVNFQAYLKREAEKKEEIIAREKLEIEEKIRKEKDEKINMEAELARQANEIREKKALELKENLQIEERLHEDLQKKIKYFNGLTSGKICKFWFYTIFCNSFNCFHILDEAALKTVFSLAIEKHATNKPKLKTMLRTIVDILDRIIASPDNINLRRIRITHQLIYSKVTGLEYGIEILVLIGFDMQVSKSIADGKKLSEASESITQTINHQHIKDFMTTEKDDLDIHQYNGTRLFPLLVPHSDWDIYLVMEEPPIDLALSANQSSLPGKQSWVDWFDNLSKNADFIRGYL